MIEAAEHEEFSKRRDRRHRSAHVQGIAPRSIYGHDEDGRAIGIACQAARGNIRPLPVIVGRKVLGIMQGRDSFSDETRFVPLPDGHRWSVQRQLLVDMIEDQKADSIARHRARIEIPTKRSRTWDAMPFGDSNDVIASTSGGKFGKTWFAKTPSAAMVANNFYDLWPVTGNPAPGTITGTARTAQRWDDTSTGATTHRGNVSTDTKHLFSLLAISQAGTPLLMPYDRVGSWDACTISTSNQTFTNTLSPQRYNGNTQAGLLPVMATCTVLGATASNLTQFRYTDNAGNATQSMPTTPTVSQIVSAAAPTTTLGARVFCPSTSANTFPWGFHLPLAAGDSGMQIPEDYTWSANNTGTFTLIGAYPLAYLILPIAGTPHEKDFVYQMPALERMYDGCCLSWMLFAPATTALAVLQGSASFGWHA